MFLLYIQCDAPQTFEKLVLKKPMNTIDISPINHTYWSYKPTWLSWGPHIVYIYIYTYIYIYPHYTSLHQASTRWWLLNPSILLSSQQCRPSTKHLVVILHRPEFGINNKPLFWAWLMLL